MIAYTRKWNEKGFADWETSISEIIFPQYDKEICETGIVEHRGI
jgi:hypothetical protein